MPVRIYDISKKLGLENKEVLSKAKELGIAAARVASSSLDKITAEYLEQQLIQAYPNLANPAPVAAPPASVSAPEPIRLVTAPPPPPEQPEVLQSMATETSTAVLEPPEAPATETVTAEAPLVPPVFEPPVTAPPEVVAKEPPPPPPPVPAGPTVGDKVGFIQ